MHSQTFQSSSQLGGTHVDLPSQCAGLGGSTCPFATLCGNKPESSTPTRRTTTEGSATHSSHRNDLNWADTWTPTWTPPKPSWENQQAKQNVKRERSWQRNHMEKGFGFDPRFTSLNWRCARRVTDALRFKAREPALNCLIGETALQWAPLGIDLGAVRRLELASHA